MLFFWKIWVQKLIASLAAFCANSPIGALPPTMFAFEVRGGRSVVIAFAEPLEVVSVDVLSLPPQPAAVAASAASSPRAKIRSFIRGESLRCDRDEGCCGVGRSECAARLPGAPERVYDRTHVGGAEPGGVVPARTGRVEPFSAHRHVIKRPRIGPRREFVEGARDVRRSLIS